MRILVAIPVYNEIDHVDRVLDRVRAIHDDVLVIDDGSTDGTVQRLEARSDVRHIRHARNRGYGQSLIDAMDWAAYQGYDWAITMDCDEQHEPAHIPQFIQAIQTDQWDLISGSRYAQPRGDDDLPPGDRRLINATITQLLNDLLGLHITDAFCGFKAHRLAAMQRLDLTEAGYAFPMQLWPQAVKAGLRITELPVRLIYNDPDRHFGGALDNPQVRLRHYLDVLKAQLGYDPIRAARQPCSCAP